MAVKPFSSAATRVKSTIFLFFLITTIQFATSARLLDEAPTSLGSQQPSFPATTDAAAATTTLPDIPATPVEGLTALVPPEPTAPTATPANPLLADTLIPLTDVPAEPATQKPPVVPPEATAPVAAPTDPLPADARAAPADLPVDSVPAATKSPAPLPTATGGNNSLAKAGAAKSAPGHHGVNNNPAAKAGAAKSAPGGHPTLSFFMHDDLGGSHASGRIVTGIIASLDPSVIPFSKPNNDVFPVSGSVPLFNGQINYIVNNRNVPFLASLNGQQLQQQSNNVIQNTGNNNNVINGNNNQAFVTAGDLHTGATLQKLMFWSITVIDDQLTQGHEPGSAVIGSAQGLYLASSLDGQSHTMAYTAMFHGGEHKEVDTISFAGVHRVAAPVSQIAVIGGTGKYENAKGYAKIETIPHVDQHTTDGVDTIVHVSVYLL